VPIGKTFFIAENQGAELITGSLNFITLSPQLLKEDVESGGWEVHSWLQLDAEEVVQRVRPQVVARHQEGLGPGQALILRSQFFI